MAPTDDLSQDLEQGPPSYFNVMEEGLPTYGEAVKEGALENPWKRLEGLMEEFDKLKCERSHIIEANEYMETFLTFKYCFIDGADNLLALNVVITLKLIFIMFVDLIEEEQKTLKSTLDVDLNLSQHLMSTSQVNISCQHCMSIFQLDFPFLMPSISQYMEFNIYDYLRFRC